MFINLDDLRDYSFAPYAFVIDTDSYSGNFERWIAAYITGTFMEGNHGLNEAEICWKELPDRVNLFKDLIWVKVDLDHDYTMNCAIFPTPGYYNDGNGINVKIEGEAPKNSFPTYQSVALFFSKKPGKKLIQVMKDRAEKFCVYAQSAKKGVLSFTKPHIDIIGYRLVKFGFTLQEEVTKI